MKSHIFKCLPMITSKLCMIYLTNVLSWALCPEQLMHEGIQSNDMTTQSINQPYSKLNAICCNRDNSIKVQSSVENDLISKYFWSNQSPISVSVKGLFIYLISQI